MLYVNEKLMKQFGYKVPTTWQQWAAIGTKVAKQHPGYVIGTVGDSYGHWLYLWPGQCPIEQVVGVKTVKIDASDVHCTRMAKLLDPLLKNGSLSNESIFTPSFAAKYGGAQDKILMMPGPTWYAKDSTLHGDARDPGRRDHGVGCRSAGTGSRSRPVRSAAVRGSSPSTPRTGRRDRLREVGHDDERSEEGRPGVPVVQAGCELLAVQPEPRPLLLVASWWPR